MLITSDMELVLNDAPDQYAEQDANDHTHGGGDHTDGSSRTIPSEGKVAEDNPGNSKHGR
jgi:hypothetical protein